MNRLLATAFILAITTLTGCSERSGSGADGKSENVAVVDGVAIKRSTYDEYATAASGKPPAELTQQQRDELLESLVRGQVLANAAKTAGVDKEPKTIATIELHRLNALQHAMTERYMKDRKATEAEMRAEYDRIIAAAGKEEYHVAHILVSTEDAAKQVISQLNAGGSFADIASKVSIDGNSKARGGDNGWLTVDTMPPPFAVAVQTLKKGETTAAPVGTEYGWHVIRLLDVRPTVPPPFESVKDRLATPVEGRKFREYVDELVSKAKVTKTL